MRTRLHLAPAAIDMPDFTEAARLALLVGPLAPSVLAYIEWQTSAEPIVEPIGTPTDGPIVGHDERL